jgi:hypothetical protein
MEEWLGHGRGKAVEVESMRRPRWGWSRAGWEEKVGGGVVIDN